MKPRPFSLGGTVDRLLVSASVLVALALHWRWFLPGIITDQDWWNYSSTAMPALWPIPSTFNFDANAGGDWRTNINYFPVEALMGAFGHLGANFALAERLVVIFPTLVLAPLAAYVLLRIYAARPAAAFVGALFYANNAYIDVIIARGQLTIAESYAIAPLVVYCAIRSVRNLPSVRLPIVTAMAFCAAVVFDLRIALLTACVTVLVVLFETRLRLNDIALLARAVAIFLVACIGLLAFIWLPIVGLHLHEAPPLDYTSASWIARLTGPTVRDLLTAYHPLWYTNVFSAWQPFFLVYFVLLAIGVWSLIRAQHLRVVVCMSLVIIIATLFAAAGNTPFGRVYEWMFVRNWFISLFRDPSKFYAPAMLAYAVFIGAAAAYVAALRPRRYAVPIIAVVALIALAPTLPAAAGLQGQLFQPKYVSASESRLSGELARDAGFSRVLWIGALDRFVPGDYRHPSVDMLWFSSIAAQGHTVVQTADSVSSALRMLGVGYVVLRTTSADGLNYLPSHLAFNTLRLYALFGVFGQPVWSSDGLTVFRLPYRLRAYPASSVPSYVLPSSSVPVLPLVSSGSAESGTLNGKPILRGRAIQLGREIIKLPQSLQLAKAEPRYVVSHVDDQGLWQDGRAVQLQAIVPLDPIVARREPDALGIDVPDWTAYMMLDVEVHHARRPTIVALSSGDFRRAYVVPRLPDGRYYLTVPARGLYLDLRVTTDQRARVRVASVWRIPASYSGLVAPSALGVVQRGRTLPLNIPLAVAVSHGSVADSGVALRLTASPAAVALSPQSDGLYRLPFSSTPLWAARGAGARVIRMAQPDALVEIQAGTGRTQIYSAADYLVREGAIVSFVAWLILAALATGWKARGV